jgi:uncharacterized protein (DUF2147 family)
MSAETLSDARAARAKLIVMLRVAPIVVLALLAATPVGAQSPTPIALQDPTPVGVWLHPNKRIEIEIAPCGEQMCGKLVWFKRPNDAQGRPLADLENPNPALRTRPLLGLTVLSGLRRAGERTWEEGRIYNPDDGADYHTLMSIRDDGALRVRAYVGLPVIGKTFIWTRVR